MIEPSLIITKLGEVAPTLIKLTLIGLLGFIGSRLLERVVSTMTAKLGLAAAIERLGFEKLWGMAFAQRTPAEVLGRLVRYLGYMFTVMALAQIAQIDALSKLVSKCIALLPTLAVTTLMALAGFWLAGLVRGLIEAVASKKRELESPKLIAQASYYLILLLTISTCASQLGLKVGLIQTLIIITIACVAAAGALALTLGAYPIIEELVARYYVLRSFAQGDHISVGELQGTLIQFAPISAILKDEHTKHSIPYTTLLKGHVRRQR